MVHISQLDHLEYKEAILDSPEFREKLKKHEKYITDTSKNIKILLKRFEEVIIASESKLLHLVINLNIISSKFFKP